MEIAEVRRRRLRAWIAEKFGGKALRFAKSIDRPQPQIAEILRGKRPFGEKIARALEDEAKMPPGWLDREDGSAEQKLLYHGIALTRAGAQLGAEWEKLDLGDRIEVEEDIRQRVQRKIVEERRRAAVAASAVPPKEPS